MAQPNWSEWTCYGFVLRISMFKPVSVHMYRIFPQVVPARISNSARPRIVSARLL